MRTFGFVAGLCAAATSATAVLAEPSSSPPVETVVVTGNKPIVQVLPDRTVYSLDKNIQSATGSLSDILRDLPSVDVDILGNISLRGDSNVTVLIDGQKSPLLAGDLADALQQIPADMIDSIEIITNPSAEFRAEGSGGIINVILKKNREMISSGLAKVSVGNDGRVNASLSGNFKIGPVRLHGSYSERRNVQTSATSILRTDDTALRSSQATSAKSANAGRHATLSAGIDVTSRDEINVGGSYNGSNGRRNSYERNISAADETDTFRDGLSYWGREGAGATLNYRHKFLAREEEFKIDASHYTSWGLNESEYTRFVTATGEADYWQSRRSASREGHTEFKMGYVLPFADRGKFKIGYALEYNASQTDNDGLERDSAAADWRVDDTFLNFFVLDRTIHAGYVSYERHFGPFGVMGGLRVEQDFLDTDLRTTGEVHDTSTLGFYPSFYLSYNVTDAQSVRVSYSRRMNRPVASALDPARYSSDAFNVRAGNPLLKPEQIDSFETSYRYMSETVDVVATGYYRATYRGITSVYRYLSSSVLLTTPDNLARRMASGAETTLNVRLWSGLSVKSNAMLAYSEYNPGAEGAGTKQSGLNFNIKGGLSWQATPRNLVQFNANYSGKQRFSQGYRKPTLSGDFAFKHGFGGGFSGLLTINNLFNSWDRNMVLDSAGLHQIDHRTMNGRIYFAGLVYSFGKSRDKDAEDADDAEDGGFQGGL